MFLEVASPSELVKDFGYAHTAGLSSKVPAVINSRVFIPLNTSLANERNALVYETEVLNAPKTAAEAWVAGAPIYWNVATQSFTTTAGGNTLCGFALEAAAAADVVAPLFLFNSFAAVS